MNHDTDTANNGNHARHRSTSAITRPCINPHASPSLPRRPSARFAEQQPSPETKVPSLVGPRRCCVGPGYFVEAEEVLLPPESEINFSGRGRGPEYGRTVFRYRAGISAQIQGAFVK